MTPNNSYKFGIEITYPTVERTRWTSADRMRRHLVSSGQYEVATAYSAATARKRTCFPGNLPVKRRVYMSVDSYNNAMNSVKSSKEVTE